VDADATMEAVFKNIEVAVEGTSKSVK
jgi:hypothetical protein